MLNLPARRILVGFSISFSDSSSPTYQADCRKPFLLEFHSNDQHFCMDVPIYRPDPDLPGQGDQSKFGFTQEVTDHSVTVPGIEIPIKTIDLARCGPCQPFIHLATGEEVNT